MSTSGEHQATPSTDVVAQRASENGHPIARGAFAMLSTKPLTWAASLASIVLVPRILGDDGLGRLAIAWTLGGYIGVIAALGLPNYVTRRVATDPAKAAAYAWGAVVLTTLAAIPLVALVVALLAVVRPTSVDVWLTLAGLAVAFGWSLQDVVLAAFVGLQRHAHYAWWAASGSVAFTVTGLTALLAGADLHGYAVALLLAIVAMTTGQWALSGIRFTRASLTAPVLKELLSGGLPFLWWNIALRVRDNADVVMTGLLLRPGVAGWLSAAYRIIGVTVFIPTVITTPLLPVLSKIKEHPTEYRAVLQQSIGTVLCLTVPLSAMIFALAPSIPDLLGWPAGLHASIPVIMILAFQQVLIGVDMVLATSLIALGRERHWLRIALIASLFNIGLNLMAIPAADLIIGNGAVGAATVEVATELVFLTCAVLLTPRGLIGREVLPRILRTVGCGLVLVAVATWLRPYSVFIAFTGGGAAYLVAAVALGVVRSADIRAVRLALRPA